MIKEREIDIQLTEDDKEILSYYAAQINSPHCYVEVGTYHGGSAWIALSAVARNVEIYAYDILDKFKLKDTPIKFILSSSYNAAKEHPPGYRIAVLFIDGDHNEAGIDFLMWEKYVVKNGIIIFHDYAHHSLNVIHHCDMLFTKNDYYKVLRKPGSDGKESSMFIVQKL